MAKGLFFAGLALVGMGFFFVALYRSLVPILGSQPTAVILGSVSLGLGILGIRRILTVFKQ